MSNNPLGPDDPRPGEVSRVERDVPFVGMGQGIERIIQVFNQFGDMIEKIVVKTEPATGSIEAINKKMDEMRSKFGIQVTHIEAFNESMDNLQRGLSVRTLSEGMANATDSVANFNKVLGLMQQNLDANVVTAKVGRLRALEKELEDRRRAKAQAKRDKERNKNILGISKSALALKGFGKAMDLIRRGAGSIEAGFNKNLAPAFDSLENFGEVLGRFFLPEAEQTALFFDRWASDIAGFQDDLARFDELTSITAQKLLGDEGLANEFTNDFQAILATWGLTEGEYADRLAELLTEITTFEREREDEAIRLAEEALEEQRAQTLLLENLVDSAFGSGPTYGFRQTFTDQQFGGLFG